MTKPFLIGVALLSAGCNAHRDNEARSSITVDLPPARPATPKPGFSLDANKAQQATDEHAAEAVHELAASLK